MIASVDAAEQRVGVMAGSCIRRRRGTAGLRRLLHFYLERAQLLNCGELQMQGQNTALHCLSFRAPPRLRTVVAVLAGHWKAPNRRET